MTAQTRLTKRDLMAHLSLLYAIWGDEVQSEALRAMMRRMSQSIEQQSRQTQATIVNTTLQNLVPGPHYTIFER